MKIRKRALLSSCDLFSRCIMTKSVKICGGSVDMDSSSRSTDLHRQAEQVGDLGCKDNGQF